VYGTAAHQQPGTISRAAAHMGSTRYRRSTDMAQSRTYTVVEANHYDQQEGLVIGAQVEAEPAANSAHLLVTRIVGSTFLLEEPIAVNKSQLALA
jgi:hypothetical protein